MNPKVDWYFDKATKWREEIIKLRAIVLSLKVNGIALSEELKWGVPCYTYEESNIVLIHIFKEYCAVLFFKGVLLSDPHGILIQQTKNVQAARQVRFTSVSEVSKLSTILKAYIKEAMEIEKAGLKVKLKKTEEYTIPEEFQKKLREIPSLKKAFKALTPR